jgi:hypothetical protein
MRYRLNPLWLAGYRCNLLFGLNRWKNMKQTDHELYDALIGDFSMMQSIHYHPKNAKTVTFGFGLYQGIYYVYSRDISFEAGFTVHLGMQL